jgi:hypothetical protein
MGEGWCIVKLPEKVSYVAVERRGTVRMGNKLCAFSFITATGMPSCIIGTCVSRVRYHSSISGNKFLQLPRGERSRLISCSPRGWPYFPLEIFRMQADRCCKALVGAHRDMF